MGPNERIFEQYDNEEDAFSEDLSTLTPEELGIMKDVPLMNQEQESEQIAPPKSKRTRGPTMCKDVHEWKLEERKPIVLNEMGKPIGLDDKTMNTFTRFLGTLARNSSLAPLNKISWHYVPDKEQIWSYVKKKCIISEKGKDCVLSSVGRLWRRYKCSVKATHFTLYENDGDRLTNSPNTIPEAHFKELLEIWNLEPVQEDGKKKREISIDKKDRHTMGPMTLARKQHKLQQLDVEKKPPSLALMYKESRKRKAHKKYKTSYEPTQSNIDKMEEVQIQSEIDGDVAYYEVMNKPNNFGHRKNQPGICSLRGKSNNPIIPNEFLKPYKNQIVKETVVELMKTLKQIDPEVLDTLTRSVENVSSNPELTDHIPIVLSNEQQQNEMKNWDSN
ncbi:uncharacterized protein LOC110729246 isoform X3 [Chenopodium quinoa]|uniref:uncharacterized protein LOC110729246 isoform X3 n=1 Tax=Chenopodium quinoa TaxID=63459 RepID=UPI000B7826D2|nr:uncharacterized protein LOC110729246 isoform X3 [Chenopodium quinoa]